MANEVSHTLSVGLDAEERREEDGRRVDDIVIAMDRSSGDGRQRWRMNLRRTCWCWRTLRKMDSRLTETNMYSAAYVMGLHPARCLDLPYMEAVSNHLDLDGWTSSALPNALFMVSEYVRCPPLPSDISETPVSSGSQPVVVTRTWSTPFAT